MTAYIPASNLRRTARKAHANRAMFQPIEGEPNAWKVITGKDGFWKIIRQNGDVFLTHPGDAKPRTVAAILTRFEQYINLPENTK